MSSLSLISFGGYSLEQKPSLGVEFQSFIHLASLHPTQNSHQITLTVLPSPLLPKDFCSHFSVSTQHSFILLSSWLCVAFVQQCPQLLEWGSLSLIHEPLGLNTMTPWSDTLLASSEIVGFSSRCLLSGHTFPQAIKWVSLTSGFSQDSHSTREAGL